MTSVDLSGDFTLSLMFEVPPVRAGAVGGLISKFDDESRTGFNLSAIASAGGYNGLGDEVRLSFGIDAGTEPKWVDCGRPSAMSNYVSNSLTVFDGYLHAATSDAPSVADRGHVFRYQGEMDWTDLGKIGRGDAHGVGPLIVHDGGLYAATWNYDWTRVHQEELAACRVYRFDGAGRWIDCGQPGKAKRLFSLASFRGELLVAGDDATIHAHRGGTSWELVQRFETFAHPMNVHQDRLIVGMLQPATVWSFDGTAWEDLGNPLGDPERCDEIHSITTYGDALHVGTWRWGRVARWDAERRRWRQMGRLGDSTEIMALEVFNGKLYGSSIPRAEVFRFERQNHWTRVARFFAPDGWQPVLVANMTAPPDGDRRMREWTRVTSLTQHDGRLFASIGSCTSAANDAPADIRGSVQAMTAGVVATTLGSLTSGRHHIAATRRGGKLAIHVDGQLMASATGGVNGSIATEAALSIGRDPRGSVPGRIERFEAFDRVLEPEEIKRLGLAAAAGL